jgi:hypothetical protein
MSVGQRCREELQRIECSGSAGGQVVKQQQIMLFYLEEGLEISYGQDFVYVENHIISSESRGSDGICVALRS